MSVVEGGTTKRRGGRPNRRDEIVLAAAEAFSVSGYHNTSLTAISDQLGMTAAGILHHFGSKENLLTEVLAWRDKVSRENQATTGSALIDHMVDTAARNQRTPGLTQLYAVLSAESVTTNHPAQDWFRNRYVTVREEVEAALRCRAGLDPQGSSPASRSAAQALVAVMDGLQVQWLLNPDIDMAAGMAFAADALVDRLRKADG
ncbi:TetR/AcrR family transcriptional regulator [Aestuariimicrobium ganziense]|uniref:TetR/AcrR family transcriptional regulator n=1 Tax=Aestuariimicrobium ganziense TaxID=2773677 RepID=UPI001940B5E5|nr:TetR/AcrR family transcriptional regulator [Aestuariimicrobium ganziense]